VKVDRKWCVVAAQLSLELGVHGHRADVLLVKAAAALAALEGRTTLGQADLEQVAAVVLPHRLRRRGFDDPTALSTAESAAALAQRVSEALHQAGSLPKKQ